MTSNGLHLHVERGARLHIKLIVNQGASLKMMTPYERNINNYDPMIKTNDKHIDQ